MAGFRDGIMGSLHMQQKWAISIALLEGMPHVGHGFSESIRCHPSPVRQKQSDVHIPEVQMWPFDHRAQEVLDAVDSRFLD